nr:PREDICTED: histone-lysine N-methyltransferase SETMAR [Apteryx mantelli mantelli]
MSLLLLLLATKVVNKKYMRFSFLPFPFLLIKPKSQRSHNAVSLVYEQYSPDNVAGADGDIDPTEITFPGCSCLTSSCVVRVCSCLCRGENYNNLCIKPTDKEEEYARPIFECNAMCQCGESCQNRVVQRGLQFRLEVFKTVKKGWGLRTLEFIAKGRFVCEYAGEVLGFNEARRRIQAQTSKDSNYIIAVREHLHNGQKALSKEEQVAHQKKHIFGRDFHCNRNVTEVLH